MGLYNTTTMDNPITMDALTLLREVSDAYRSLRSLSVEASILTTSGDENFSQQSEQRVHFVYAAPDRIPPRDGLGISTERLLEISHEVKEFDELEFV